MLCTTLHHPFKHPLVFDLWSFFSIPPFDITMFSPCENDLQVYVHLPALEQEEFLMLPKFKLAINNRFIIIIIIIIKS